jgi:hypothetical protein
MLIVRAEIWPGGDGHRSLTIGEIIAANESRGADASSYGGSVTQEPAPQINIARWRREFMLADHPRRNGVWPLVATMLANPG